MLKLWPKLMSTNRWGGGRAKRGLAGRRESGKEDRERRSRPFRHPRCLTDGAEVAYLCPEAKFTQNSHFFFKLFLLPPNIYVLKLNDENINLLLHSTRRSWERKKKLKTEYGKKDGCGEGRDFLDCEGR